MTPKRRDLRALLFGTICAVVGWVGRSADFLPIRVIREPGWESGIFLDASLRPRTPMPWVPEWVVFTINLVFWSALVILTLGIRRAILRAWKAQAWLLVSALVATPLVFVAEVVGHYFGEPFKSMWWVTYPGWVLKDLVRWLPSMTVVIDMPSLLGEFFYPDRLANLVTALVLAVALWTLVCWVAILSWRLVQRLRVREHAAVA